MHDLFSGYKKLSEQLTDGYIEDYVSKKLQEEEYKKREKDILLYKNNYLLNHKLNDLVLLTRATCHYCKQKISNNSHKVWPGETLIRETDEEGNVIGDGVFAIRPDDKYDWVLFSKIFVNFEQSILIKYQEIAPYVDLDDWVYKADQWIRQSIRHFEPEKALFNTLGNTMIKNAAVNILYENGAKAKDEREKNADINDEYYQDKFDPKTQYLKSVVKGNNSYLIIVNKETDEIVRKLSNKRISHEMGYRNVKSLDALVDNKIQGCLPITEMETEHPCEELKKKYKEENDFMSWAFVDCQMPESELYQNPEFSRILDECKDEKKKEPFFDKVAFKVAMGKVLKLGLYKEFGFSEEKCKAIFSTVLNTTNESEFDKLINKSYKDSVNKLKEDVQDYGMCM